MEILIFDIGSDKPLPFAKKPSWESSYAIVLDDGRSTWVKQIDLWEDKDKSPGQQILCNTEFHRKEIKVAKKEGWKGKLVEFTSLSPVCQELLTKQLKYLGIEFPL